MIDPNPRPTIDVAEKTDAPGGTIIDVKISRGSVVRRYAGAGTTTTERVKDVVGKILADPHTAEWLPEVKKP